jgi:hypothetical protein
MLLLPWPRAALQVAWPLLSATAPQPDIVALLAVKATVPVGVPDEELTVAVKVTVFETFDGFVLLLMVVVVEGTEAYVIVIDQLVIDIGLVMPESFCTVNVHCPFAVVVLYLLVSVGAEQDVAPL